MTGELEQVADALVREFAGVFGRETVAECVRDCAGRLAPARAFVPALAHRFARERLRASALAVGAAPRPVPVVLFVCTHNAGRSQLAAALLARAAAGRVEVMSAGTSPAAQVDPAVRAALAEVGADLAGAYPKPLTSEVVAAADVVVTMGRGDACPVLPGRRYLDWELPDPAGQDLPAVRAVRAEVERRAAGLLADLPPAGVAGPPPAPGLDPALLRLLADPVRARIVSALAVEELCTCHLVELTGARQTNVSNHLKALKRAGLVGSEPAGRYTYYRLRPDRVRELAGQLRAVADALGAVARPARRQPC